MRGISIVLIRSLLKKTVIGKQFRTLFWLSIDKSRHSDRAVSNLHFTPWRSLSGCSGASQDDVDPPTRSFRILGNEVSPDRRGVRTTAYFFFNECVRDSHTSGHVFGCCAGFNLEPALGTTPDEFGIERVHWRSRRNVPKFDWIGKNDREFISRWC